MERPKTAAEHAESRDDRIFSALERLAAAAERLAYAAERAFPLTDEEKLIELLRAEKRAAADAADSDTNETNEDTKEHGQ